MIRKPTRQLKRLAARKGVELVRVQPEPAMMQLFHAGCGVRLVGRDGEVVCPKCDVVITADTQIETIEVQP